jgi:hypothetical protein
MDLDTLLADPCFDLPVPAGAMEEVDRSARRVRLRRRVLIGGPVLAVAALGVSPLGSGTPSGSVTYADSSASPEPPPLPYQPPETAMRLNCAAGVTQQEVEREGGFTAISNFFTGYPLVDCAQIRTQQGEADVPLSAYGDGHAALTVVPSSWTLPARYEALPAGFHVELARVAAETALEDPIDGVDESAGCYSETAAIAMAKAVLREVGLPSYSVRSLEVARGADGVTMCAFAIFPTEAGTQVLLQGHPYERFRDTTQLRFRDLLRHDVAQRCLTLDEAIAKVEQDAAKAGDSGRGFSIARRTDRGPTSCTRVDLVLSGGGPVVVLRRS